MISLSAYRPVQPVSLVTQRCPQPPACPPKASQTLLDVDRFHPVYRKETHFGDWWGYPDYSRTLKVDGHYYTGFTPDVSIKDLFNTRSSPAVWVIDTQRELDQLWKQVNMPKRDKPKVDWRQEAIVVVAQERTSSTSAMPKSMSYDRNRDVLTVRLEKETTKGRDFGTAWYIGKFPNGADEGRRSRENYQLDSRSRVYVREIAPDNDD